MPNATIYIRKENWDTWESLADKSLQVNHWLTVARNGETTIKPDKVIKANKLSTDKKSVRIKPDVQKVATPIVKAEPLSKTCKAGHTALDTGFCLTKGCKYNTTNRGKK